uniref:Uncharacterized protein n=1 Tax=Bracon brevicornis TaxID=1563983 RepID=A0A6V7M5W1_9HYME
MIGVAMRNAMNKYKRYGSVPMEVPPLPSLLFPGKTSSRVIRSSSVTTKSRNLSSRTKKETPSMAEMYAVGLGLTK